MPLTTIYCRKMLTSMFAAALLGGGSIAYANEWTLEKEDVERDIRVYTRTVENSPLKEFKGVTQITAPTSAFVALLRDPDVATEWMHQVGKFEVIESPSMTDNLVYTVNETPWPVTDRDAYIRSVMSQDESKVVTVTLTGVPEFRPVNEDFVRMASLKGFWKFSPQENGITEVTYQVHANPGGSLPDWLVNGIVVDTPYNTLKNLQVKVVEERYQNQSFDFMK